MLVSFLISRLVTFLALRFILCGVSASPIPAPLPLDEVSEPTTDLEERGAMHSGGQGTYFYPGLGACGWYNGSKDLIVALSAKVYKKSYCGKYISISSRGKTHKAKVVDMCPGCSTNSLDMSPALFRQFAKESVGVINVNWKFV